MSVVAGYHFISGKPIVLGAMSLDLVAVLLGGATALLAVYVHQVFRAGPWALGLLVLLGASDTVSMIIRQSLVQLQTPDAMRGRVSAVHSVVTGASNELGEFESGMLAAAVGAVPAVAIGGLGAIAAALVWGVLFPALRDADRLEDSPAPARGGKRTAPGLR